LKHRNDLLDLKFLSVGVGEKAKQSAWSHFLGFTTAPSYVATQPATKRKTAIDEKNGTKLVSPSLSHKFDLGSQFAPHTHPLVEPSPQEPQQQYPTKARRSPPTMKSASSSVAFFVAVASLLAATSSTTAAAQKPTNCKKCYGLQRQVKSCNERCANVFRGKAKQQRRCKSNKCSQRQARVGRCFNGCVSAANENCRDSGNCKSGYECLEGKCEELVVAVNQEAPLILPDEDEPEVVVDPTPAPGTVGTEVCEWAVPDACAIGAEAVTACSDLYAGQFTLIGSVCAAREPGTDNLLVTYTTTGGWYLGEAVHLWVGDDVSAMPQSPNGNPKNGNFPYVTEGVSRTCDGTGSQQQVFTVANFYDDSTCSAPSLEEWLFAAHAESYRCGADGAVAQTETAWSSGVQNGSNWSMVSNFCKECACSVVVEPQEEREGTSTCETAFAKSDDAPSPCFLDVDADGDGRRDFSRWGWYNGPIGAGTYAFPIYAGAGQCDTSKGTLVGTLSVAYDGAAATVTYAATPGTTYGFDEVHLYVGSEMLPRDGNGAYTVAPGQYPVVDDGYAGATSVTHTVSGLSGDLYVVAHAVACGEYP